MLKRLSRTRLDLTLQQLSMKGTCFAQHLSWLCSVGNRMLIHSLLIIWLLTGIVLSHTVIHYLSYQISSTSGWNLPAIGIGSFSFAVQTADFQYKNIVLDNVLHFPKIFTKFISASSLYQNGFYLHGERQTVNRIKDDHEILIALIQNVLYMLKTIYRTFIASVVKPLLSLKLWHRRLGHPIWAYLKCVGNA